MVFYTHTCMSACTHGHTHTHKYIDIELHHFSNRNISILISISMPEDIITFGRKHEVEEHVPSLGMV